MATIQAKKKPTYSGNIKPEFFEKIREQFKIYKASKRGYDARIIENNRWFKNLYTAGGGEIPEVSTSYLFNVLATKHAEVMDNYPEPNIIERDKKDRKIAFALSKVIPRRLDLCNFKQTYSRAWWYKLKNGAACYGIFFDPTKDAAGEIVIKKIDLLNLFWEPGVSDIQDSKFLFLTSLCDAEELKRKYPAAELAGNANSMDFLTYDDNQNTLQSEIMRGKTIVIDWRIRLDGRADKILRRHDTRGERGRGSGRTLRPRYVSVRHRRALSRRGQPCELRAYRPHKKSADIYRQAGRAYMQKRHSRKQNEVYD